MNNLLHLAAHAEPTGGDAGLMIDWGDDACILLWPEPGDPAYCVVYGETVHRFVDFASAADYAASLAQGRQIMEVSCGNA